MTGFDRLGNVDPNDMFAFAEDVPVPGVDPTRDPLSDYNLQEEIDQLRATYDGIVQDFASKNERLERENHALNHILTLVLVGDKLAGSRIVAPAARTGMMVPPRPAETAVRPKASHEANNPFQNEKLSTSELAEMYIMLMLKQPGFAVTHESNATGVVSQILKINPKAFGRMTVALQQVDLLDSEKKGASYKSRTKLGLKAWNLQPLIDLADEKPTFISDAVIQKVQEIKARSDGALDPPEQVKPEMPDETDVANPPIPDVREQEPEPPEEDAEIILHAPVAHAPSSLEVNEAPEEIAEVDDAPEVQPEPELELEPEPESEEEPEFHVEAIVEQPSPVKPVTYESAASRSREERAERRIQMLETQSFKVISVVERLMTRRFSRYDMMIVTLANEEKLNMSAAVIDDTIDFMKERELIELRATTTGINGIEFVLTKAGEIFMDRKVSQIEALRKQRAEAELASEAEAESA